MSAPASAAEKTAKGISPIFFILAAICFLLPFGAVSCDTTKAKALVDSFGGSAGGTSSQLSVATACLDALNNYSLATYNGLNLALGTAPSTASNPPPACASAGGASSSSSPSALTADQAKLGVQPLALGALIVIVVGALLSLVFLFFRGRFRALLTALIAAAGIVFVLIAQLQVQKNITDKLAASFASSTAGSNVPAGLSFNFSDYFKVDWGLGVFLVIAALAVVVIANLAAAVVGPSRLAAAPAGAAPFTSWQAAAPPTYPASGGGAPPPPPLPPPPAS